MGVAWGRDLARQGIWRPCRSQRVRRGVPTTVVAAALLATLALAGCGAPREADACTGLARSDFPDVPANRTLVAFVTSEGCLVVEVFNDVVPRTAANFVRYVREGFYQDLRWHEVQPGFISQTGSILLNGSERRPAHPVIPNESGLALAAGLHNDLYTLAMVYAPSHPRGYDSAASQFLVNMGRGSGGTENRATLDPSAPGTNDGYCVFARVVHGETVADRINNRTSIMDPPFIAKARVV